LIDKILTLDANNLPVIDAENKIKNSQQWQIIPTNKQENFVFIQQIGTNQVLEIEEAITKDGAKVRLATRKRRSNNHQEWMLLPLDDHSHWYFLQNRATNNVLDIAYKKTKDGAKVASYHKKIRGYENQLWLFEEV
jgi:ribosomal silencing factor RsfS